VSRRAAEQAAARRALAAIDAGTKA
jgi:hypothetical protein